MIVRVGGAGRGQSLTLMATYLADVSLLSIPLLIPSLHVTVFYALIDSRARDDYLTSSSL